ncbi:MAG TPA: hypothetical protein VGJ79_12220 [Candidatus Dormibacteraeota bacterium]
MEEQDKPLSLVLFQVPMTTDGRIGVGDRRRAIGRPISTLALAEAHGTITLFI